MAELLHIKTQSGFECDINPSKLNDMRMVDDLAQIDKGNATYYPRVIERLVGVDGKERLYSHLETEDGTVPIDRFSAELMEIIRAIGEHNKAKK